MSLIAYRWAWAQRGLTSGQRNVLLFLAEEHREKTGLCYPGVQRIGAHCELQPRWVRRCLLALEAKGLVRIEYRTGRRHTNHYVLPVGIDAPGAAGQPGPTTGPVPGAQNGGAAAPVSDAGRGAPGAERGAAGVGTGGLAATRTVLNRPVLRTEAVGGAAPPQPPPTQSFGDDGTDEAHAAASAPGSDGDGQLTRLNPADFEEFRRQRRAERAQAEEGAG